MTTYIDEFIKKFANNSRKPSKNELLELVRESLKLINEINKWYKQFFEERSNEDWSTRVSLLEEVKTNVENLARLHDKYFKEEQQKSWETLSKNLDRFVKDIQSYHEELLTWNNSIKNDIEESQSRITAFYSFLFWEISEWEWETDDGFRSGDVRETILKQYIKDISLFYDKFSWEEDDWYKEQISSFYNFLFQKKEWQEDNLVDKTKNNINEINIFRDRKFDRIVSEIQQTKKDVDSLLNSATGGSLVEWYEQSKSEYKLTWKSFERIKINTEDYPPIIKLLFEPIRILWLLGRNIVKVILYYIGSLFNYLLFILPLAGSVIIFIQPELLMKIWIEAGWSEDISFRSRLLISIPLRWISLFGQRNISHKKRIAEEYNHKIQVLKMYLNFTTNKTNYPLSNTQLKELENTVIETIQRRPWEVYGKDESIFDKIIVLLRASRWKDDKNEQEKSKE